MKKIRQVAETYSALQHKICQVLEEADGKGKFGQNNWNKAVGEGNTCVLENGNIIEKGAVNFSFVQSKFTEKMKSILGESAQNYAATGISSILHPSNPWVPIIHMNVRYFALDNGIS